MIHSESRGRACCPTRNHGQKSIGKNHGKGLAQQDAPYNAVRSPGSAAASAPTRLLLDVLHLRVGSHFGSDAFAVGCLLLHRQGRYPLRFRRVCCWMSAVASSGSVSTSVPTRPVVCCCPFVSLHREVTNTRISSRNQAETKQYRPSGPLQETVHRSVPTG